MHSFEFIARRLPRRRHSAKESDLGNYLLKKKNVVSIPKHSHYLNETILHTIKACYRQEGISGAAEQLTNLMKALIQYVTVFFTNFHIGGTHHEI